MTDPKFASYLPPGIVCRVGDLEKIEVENGDPLAPALLKKAKGPWKSKSGGLLRVLFAQRRDSEDIMPRLGKYEHPIRLTGIREIKADEDERAYLNYYDVDGFRGYTVTEVPLGGVGGKEFHRIRHEILFGFKGKSMLNVEDVHGDKKIFMLDETTGVYVPPFMMHTFEALENNSGLVVFCNTMLDPENRMTYDSYSQQAFKELQRKFR